jgi:hypothetical protein
MLSYGIAHKDDHPEVGWGSIVMLLKKSNTHLSGASWLASSRIKRLPVG